MGVFVSKAGTAASFSEDVRSKVVFLKASVG